MDVAQAVVAGPGASLATYRSGAPRKQLAGTAIVVLGGMPARRVVTSSGRSGYGAPGRGSRLPHLQVELVPLPPAPVSGWRRSIPPRRWREGQVHDGWNREMVQRREGLRLHRP